MNKRKLPGTYEKRFGSTYLKQRIATDGLWAPIPGVSPNMNSEAGIARLHKNRLLFDFLDEFFPKGPFVFEPNMSDGRFMCIPTNVYHQGIAVCSSLRLSGMLEVGHFWYPNEYLNEGKGIGIGQLYVDMFSIQPGPELAQMMKGIYENYVDMSFRAKKCTFPFFIDKVVTLEGYFLDDVPGST